MSDRKFDEEALASSLRLLADETARLDAPPEIEQKLREAFRARAATTTAAKSYTPYWLTAVAAILLIVIGVIALRMRTDERHEVTADFKPAAPTKEQPAPVIEETPKKEEVTVKPPRRRSVRRTPRSEVANHVTREIATDFMPLGYLNAATLQDGGQIVRVELPRSALVNFGLPVNMERYNEKVKADVLLGVDGMARAIRFVQ